MKAADGRIWDTADPARALRFVEAVVLAEAAHGTLGAVGSYTPPRSVAKWKGAGVGPTPTYSYSAAAVEVSVPAAGAASPGAAGAGAASPGAAAIADRSPTFWDFPSTKPLPTIRA